MEEQTKGEGKEQPQPSISKDLAAVPLEYGGKKYATSEELGKAYEAAQAELGKWTQQHGDLEKKYRD